MLDGIQQNALRDTFYFREAGLYIADLRQLSSIDDIYRAEEQGKPIKDQRLPDTYKKTNKDKNKFYKHIT